MDWSHLLAHLPCDVRELATADATRWTFITQARAGSAVLTPATLLRTAALHTCLLRHGRRECGWLGKAPRCPAACADSHTLFSASPDPLHPTLRQHMQLMLTHRWTIRTCTGPGTRCTRAKRRRACACCWPPTTLTLAQALG